MNEIYLDTGHCYLGTVENHLKALLVVHVFCSFTVLYSLKCDNDLNLLNDKSRHSGQFHQFKVLSV